MSWGGFNAVSYGWLATLAAPLVLFYFLKLKRPRLQVPSLTLWRHHSYVQCMNDWVIIHV